MMQHKISKTYDEPYDSFTMYTHTDALDALIGAGAHQDCTVRFSHMAHCPDGVTELSFYDNKIVALDDTTAEFEWAVTYTIDQPNERVTVKVEQAVPLR